MFTYPHINNTRGVTLIELMLAVAISAILLLGVGTLYGNSKRTYTVDEEFAHLQENARIAMKYLVEDIRMAGYMGCVWNDATATKFGCYLDNGGGGSYACTNLNAGLEGFEAPGTNAGVVGGYTMVTDSADTTSPYRLTTTTATTGWTYNTGSMPAQFPAATRPPVVGSDIIIVRHGGERSSRLSQDRNANDNNFFIADMGGSVNGGCHDSTGICNNDILIASDCSKSRVFQATTVSNGGAGAVLIVRAGGGIPGNVTTPDVDNFKREETEIMKLRTYAYFISNNAGDQPALFRHNGINGVATEELVEGIENMQILYGIDTDADNIANQYVSANTVNFNTLTTPIVSVRIGLLVRSKENIPSRPTTPATFRVAGTDITNSSTVAQPDQRLRKIFTTTIKIRNKGL